MTTSSEILRADGRREPLVPGATVEPGDIVVVADRRIDVASRVPVYTAALIALLERAP